MKVMISQPMRGKTGEEIRSAREAVVNNLTEQGWEVVNTVFDDFSPSAKPLEFLARSIEFMAHVDGVVFMSGWAEARGCRVEHMCALEYGKFVLDLA